MNKRFSLLCAALVLAVALSAIAATACEWSRAEARGERSAVPQMANMADPESRAAAERALSRSLGRSRTTAFLAWVDDYNAAMPAKLLRRGFAPGTDVAYDSYRLGEAWVEHHGSAPGTNCRLNSYLLLKDAIGIRPEPIDDHLLFIDKDAIRSGKLMDAADEARFLQLFSAVPTRHSRDVRVQARAMARHLQGVTFSERARLLSVVMHDAIDGDALFIGHCGVLAPEGKGWLFVEKLAFDKPYQVIRFATVKDCYRYLYHSYESYADEETAPPFVMDNDRFVDPEDLTPQALS